MSSDNRPDSGEREPNIDLICDLLGQHAAVLDALGEHGSAAIVREQAGLLLVAADRPSSTEAGEDGRIPCECKDCGTRSYASFEGTIGVRCLSCGGIMVPRPDPSTSSEGPDPGDCYCHGCESYHRPTEPCRDAAPTETKHEDESVDEWELRQALVSAIASAESRQKMQGGVAEPIYLSIPTARRILRRLRAGRGEGEEELDRLREYKASREAQVRGEVSQDVRALTHNDADYLRILACMGKTVVNSVWLRAYADRIDATLAALDEEDGGG